MYVLRITMSYDAGSYILLHHVLALSLLLLLLSLFQMIEASTRRWANWPYAVPTPSHRCAMCFALGRHAHVGHRAPPLLFNHPMIRGKNFGYWGECLLVCSFIEKCQSVCRFCSPKWSYAATLVDDAKSTATSHPHVWGDLWIRGGPPHFGNKIDPGSRRSSHRCLKFGNPKILIMFPTKIAMRRHKMYTSQTHTHTQIIIDSWFIISLHPPWSPPKKLRLTMFVKQCPKSTICWWCHP